MGSLIYALKENARGEAPFPVTVEKAIYFNSLDYGIFRAVNTFDGARRKTNLLKINAWHVDIDKGSKPEQLLKIKNSPIYPSRIVESKNGYHLYFNASSASPEKYKTIMKGLTRYFGGDEKAAIMTALLREPTYYHKKDQDSPFLVKEILNIGARYNDDDMLYFFGEKPKVRVSIDPEVITNERINMDDLTGFLNNLDNEMALMRLSGSSYVGGETYTFKDVGQGKKNILVNGKTTSCFIDQHKRIGATPGGPHVWTWLRYFNHSDKHIYRIIKDVFGGIDARAE
jgi:hypothetical protein